jgi:1-acyl-sn-glycerol-3-phosphate acyltransferase
MHNNPKSIVKDVHSEQQAKLLLEIIAQLAKELHPNRLLPPLSLNSLLDREYGFDSLSRVELLLRIEQHFRVKLPEQLLALAETPGDLLYDLQNTSDINNLSPVKTVNSNSQPELTATPYNAQTLIEVLEWHVATHPQRTHIHLYLMGDEKAQEISYQDLYDGARSIAAGLRDANHMPGERVAIMLPTCREYLFSFYGVLMAGGVPVPIYPPVRPSQLEDHLRRHVKILNNAGVSHLITVAEAKLLALLLKSQVDSLQSIATPVELMHSNNSFSPPPISADDIAFLQYTSGSTGNPKGVVLSHRHLLANIRSMGEMVQVNSNDRFVSWLPLYHDMGLIGAWLSSLYFSCPLILMSPLTFLVRPQRWLWAIHSHKATLSAAPNFAYELCLNKVNDSDIDGLDLSSWRMAFNGAEPVSPKTVRRFVEHFSQYGFQWQTMTPVYGLAECTVGLAFPPPGRGPVIDQIERQSLTTEGKAIPVKEVNENTLEFVASGQPLPGYEIRIIDPEGRELPERHEGRLQFCGPSATQGYFHNPEQTRKLLDGKWLNSGDLAYMSGGDIYITSRTKDIIIRAGRNIYPYEVEEMVGNIKGIRKGCVAVFGTTEQLSATERVVILAETREKNKQLREVMFREIASVVSDLMGVSADEILLVAPHTVLKTSSGKIRRAACRKLYQQGQLGQTRRAVWWQLSRLALSSILPQFRQLQRKIFTTLFAGYAWLSFLILALLVWILVVTLPSLKWRWTVMRSAGRLLLFLTRTPLNIEGIKNIPHNRPFVLVANHASYLDGLILVASLAQPFSFVVKQELRNNWINRLFLQRINSEFVERFDAKKGADDANQLIQHAQNGRSFAFFPEGTFTRMPGLLAFRMGAFSTAAQAGIAVVPVIICGTRSILRAKSWFPRHGEVSVNISKMIKAQGSNWDSIIKLRDNVRAEILHHYGEPDLSKNGLINNYQRHN